MPRWGRNPLAEVAGLRRGTWMGGGPALDPRHPLARGQLARPHRLRTPGLASLRNLADGAFRLTGRTDITEAGQWAGRYMTRPFIILGLNS